MAYQVVSGDISQGILYSVVGAQSVIYNGNTYATGTTFRGVLGVRAFSYSGSGTQEVNEVTELFGSGILFNTDANDAPASFNDVTLLYGMAIEFSLNDEEKIVNEVTKIQGFAIELVDYPFFSFEITETRL